LQLVHNPFDRYYKEMINLVEQRMNALLHSMKTTNRAITSPLQRISHPILKRVSTILDLEAPTTSLSNSSSPHASPSVPSTPPPMMLSSSSLSSSSKGESYESLLDVLRRGNTNDLDLSDLVSVLRIKTFLSNFRYRTKRSTHRRLTMLRPYKALLNSLSCNAKSICRMRATHQGSR